MLSPAKLKVIRRRSAAQAKFLGYAVNPGLPAFGGEDVQLRSPQQLRERMLCLTAVLWRAAGLSEGQTRTWLEKGGLVERLTAAENTYLLKPENNPTMSPRAEALYALAWAGGLVADLDFSRECPKNLVRLFPNVPGGQSAASFSESLPLRSEEQLIEQCDLAYCLHWAIRDAALHGRQPPGKLLPVYVVERRLALEWMIQRVDWDDVALDT